LNHELGSTAGGENHDVQEEGEWKYIPDCGVTETGHGNPSDGVD
jgi:hypothetical protein